MQKSAELEANLARLKAENPDGFAAYMSEAEFGLQEIGPELTDCRRGLEIGAGSGLLSFMLAHCTTAQISAIEPVAEGFEGAGTLLESIDRTSPANLSVTRCDLESFDSEESFDLVWSVNVFEHLPDWRAALLKTRKLLSPGGRAILLFPNYDIPYEPHFRIPLIGGRRTAGWLFAGRIARYEDAHQAGGLWASLNFIKASELLRFAWENGLDVEVDRSITVRMFERLETDSELKVRQGLLSLPAAAFRALGLHRAWAAMPPVVQPYLRIVLTAPA